MSEFEYHEWNAARVAAIMSTHFNNLSPTDQKRVIECCVRALRKEFKEKLTPPHVTS